MSPEKAAPPFLSPEDLAVDITPENLTIEARRLRPDVPQKARKEEPPRDKPLKKKTNQPQDQDRQARFYSRRKYRALQEKEVPHGPGGHPI